MKDFKKGELAKASLKRLLSYIPIAKDFVAIQDELEKSDFDRKMKNSLNAILTMLVDEREKISLLEHSINRKIEQYSSIDSEEKNYILPQLKSLHNLIKDISKRVELVDFQSLLVRRLKFNETALIAESVQFADLYELIKLFHHSIEFPILSANIADILFEAHGQKNIITNWTNELKTATLLSMRKAEKKDNLIEKIRTYEVLGALGMVVDDSQFYSKYLELIANNKFDTSRDIVRSLSWWSYEHYYSDKKKFKEEYMNDFQKNHFNQLTVHYMLMLTTTESSLSMNESLELFEIPKEFEVYKKLEKLNFGD